MCIFENDTVKSDCPMQESYDIFKDIIQTVGVYLLVLLFFFMEILKKEKEKKTLKMTSQLVIFRAFFLFFFFVPSTLNLIFFPRKSTNKKIWPNG